MTFPPLLKLQTSLKNSVPDVELIQAALNHSSPYLQYEAYQLLRTQSHPIIDQALRRYPFWRHFERLDSLPHKHAQMFANRPVVEVSSFLRNQDTDKGDRPPLTTKDSGAIAYGIRQSRWGWNNPEEPTVEAQLVDLLLSEAAHPIEALVFGYWGHTSSKGVVSNLVRERESLPQLKALFIGDIEDQEQMISDIEQTELRSLLRTFPALEILHIRGDRRDHRGWRAATGDNFQVYPGLRFSKLHHEKLTALVVETGGLNREAVRDLCASDWPALEYLELWFGAQEYGSTASVDDITPILSGDVFPTLKYLGLRNCEFADDLAIALAQFPPRPSLIELDFSLGTLTDIGVQALLNSAVLESLDRFNISRCYVSGDVLPQLSALEGETIGLSSTKTTWAEISGYPRYCRVAE